MQSSLYSTVSNTTENESEKTGRSGSSVTVQPLSEVHLPTQEPSANQSTYATSSVGLMVYVCNGYLQVMCTMRSMHDLQEQGVPEFQ